MIARNTFQLEVYKGWTSKEPMDAKLYIYSIDSERQQQLEDWKMYDRFNFIKVDKRLKDGLRFSLNLARRQVFQNSRITICLWTLATFVALGSCWKYILTNGEEERNDGQKVAIVFISIAIIIFSSSLFERYIILQRLREMCTFMVEDDLGPTFRSKGWQLEFQTRDWSSLTGVAAFFKLTAIPAPQNDADTTKTMSPSPSMTNTKGVDVWICASNLDSNSSCGSWCCGSRLSSVLNGIPSDMKPSVDIFLWGSLAEACVKARIDHNLNRSQCLRQMLQVFILLLFFAFAVCLRWIFERFQYPRWKKSLMFITGVITATVSWRLWSMLEAHVARSSFHPKMRKITDEFASEFEQVGYRMEYYVAEEEDGLYGRKGGMLSSFVHPGKSYFRFEPLHTSNDSGSARDWLV